MLERLHSDSVVQKVTLGGVVNRAELAVAPTPQSAELRDKAVAPVVQAQRSATEPNPLSAPAHAVGRIRDEFDKIAQVESDRKMLDAIIGKLLPGYKALMDKIDAPATVRDAEHAVVQLEALKSKLSGSSAAAEAPQGADVTVSESGDATLAKIEGALRTVDDLRAKLADDHAGAHERLMNLGASAAQSGGVTKSTAAARELIMTNVRAVGAAHARLSPDMARLVLG